MPLRVMIGVTTFVAALVCATSAWATVVSDWNAAALAEVRLSKSLRNGPPIVARALAIAHTCMYDAWAGYDRDAVGTTDTEGMRRRPEGEWTDDNKKKAISFAAYRCLTNLYPGTTSAARLRAVLTPYLSDESELTNMDPNSGPAGVGNIAAQAVIDARRYDGSNQYGDHTPAPCPVPVPRTWPLPLLPPPPLLPCAATAYKQTATHPTPAPGEVWAYSDYVAADYEPYVPTNPVMGYCNPLVAVCERQDIVDPNHWQPLIFSNGQACLDGLPAPPGQTFPLIRTVETCPGIQVFIAPHWERVTPFALTSADQFDSELFIPPPDYAKNSGRYQADVNDMIQYSRSLDTRRKLIVEYWADGPSSELPPGHWGLFAQFVSQRDNHTIDQDVKMFFAMHNASFDAGIMAWHIKRKYNGVRPITAIRFTKQGQNITAWGGPGRPIEQIPGEKWSPYNPGTNLTPPFPGYFSGHSVFSRSSATVLWLFTGDDYFGFSTVLPPGFGRVEPGIPLVPTTFFYETFSDAANEAGLSRLYGGIHFADDNTTAQYVGDLIGQQAWAKALMYFNGTAP